MPYYMNQLSGILWLSVFFQAIAVVLALRLIPLSRKAMAWGLLSLAFLLMTMRRTISLLYQNGVIKSDWLHAFSTEIVALIISLLTVSGVFLIRNIFIQRNESEDKLNTLMQAVEQSSVGIIITNTNFEIQFINQKFKTKYSLHPNNWTGKTIDNMDMLINASKEIKGKINSFSDLCLKAQLNKTLQIEIALQDENENIYWESISVSPVIENSNVTQYTFVFEDISENITQEKELEKLALYDSLTNLPNRKLFIDRLEQQIISASRNQENFAVLLLDLDRFKEVNDTLGHAVGDVLLTQLGPLLKNALRKDDTIARMGGDEFLILLPQVNHEKITVISNKILDTLTKPITVNEYVLDISASIGCAIFPQHGKDVKSLIKQADVAMYHAKRNQMSLSIYNKNFDAHSIEKLGLVGELKHAINNHELNLVYQVKMNLLTGEYIGVEALTRWQHPERGEISPGEFIPIAEQTGLIRQITRWVLQTAVEQCKSWHKIGLHLNTSINLSAKDLHDPNLPLFLEELLCDNPVCANFITLEITESAIMTDVKSSLKILNTLNNMGIKLSIDDFGTGYSSLEYLARLPVSELKIDRSFVAKMINNQNERVIVRSTIELAHNLGLHVVAEGVEEIETMNMLKALQCDVAQGFYINHPVSPNEITTTVQAENSYAL